jgi:hypothetical protein
MSEQTRVHIRPNVFAREFDGEIVVVDLEHGHYFGLNAVGARAWLAFASGQSVGQVASSLLSEYEVDRATLVDDLSRLVRELADHGLVVLE